MRKAGSTFLRAALGTVLSLAAGSLSAQTAPPIPSVPPAQPASADTMLGTITIDQFVSAHIAVSALRDQVHAELAEPRNKRPELLLALREKLLQGTRRILREHRMTEATYHGMTRRVSTDDAMRMAFDSAMTRRSAVKRGS